MRHGSACIPRAVLERHTQNQIDDHLHDARPARLHAVGCSSIWLPPAPGVSAQGVRCDQRFQLVQHFATERVRFSGESSTFGVGEANAASAQEFLENAILFLEVVESREALRAALHRLRRLLGGENRVLSAEGRIALNASHCWVDAWTFEHALEENVKSSNASAERVLALYHGPLVDDENTAHWALACYGRGLHHGGLVEAFYQRVLACCATLGRRAEGLAAYARCREHLREALGVSPSDKTESLRLALTGNR